MKKILLALIMAVCLTSCTHNNGDIGPFFGQWAMTYITCDGAPVEGIDDDDYNWRFQNDIVMICLADRMAHTTLSYVATWEQQGNDLLIDFRQTSDHAPNGVNVPTDIGFTQRNTLYTLRIVELKGSSMKLTMDSPNGHTYAYTLRKLN